MELVKEQQILDLLRNISSSSSSGGGGVVSDASAANQIVTNSFLTSIDTKLTNPLPISGNLTSSEKKIQQLYSETLAPIYIGARSIPDTTNYKGLLLKITNTSTTGTTGTSSGINILTNRAFDLDNGVKLPYYILANNAGPAVGFNISQLQQGNTAFGTSHSVLEVTYLYYPNPMESDKLSFIGQKQGNNGILNVTIYGLQFDISQYLLGLPNNVDATSANQITQINNTASKINRVQGAFNYLRVFTYNVTGTQNVTSIVHTGTTNLGVETITETITYVNPTINGSNITQIVYS